MSIYFGCGMRKNEKENKNEWYSIREKANIVLQTDVKKGANFRWENCVR